MTRLVLVLHSHLPWVLHHGRWPHGSDWLTEAAVDTYLPLLEVLLRLQADGVAAPISLGITPVLANQLAHPDFATELDAFFVQRLTACTEAAAALEDPDATAMRPLVAYWQARYARLRTLFDDIGHDLIGAFGTLAESGRLELFSSAATHGFLPLLGRDESIRLQLQLGAAEHRRLFGRDAAGCWMPECAYRPGGPWHPLPNAPDAGRYRDGIERFVAEAGFRCTVVDTHLTAEAQPLGASGGIHGGAAQSANERAVHHLHRVGPDLAVFTRDPRLSAQVWSRFEGYPGDGRYLEFHKTRWPGGLKLWRVTGSGVDLGDKAPYDAAAAHRAAQDHAAHFAHLAARLGAEADAEAVFCAPFDTELFGHWWFEGPDFLEATFRCLATERAVTPSLAADALREAGPLPQLTMPSGSWGANGDWSMWLSPATAWTWERLWPLESRFWDTIAAHLDDRAAHDTIAQAARALLLAQSSDWQFIISTGAAADYAEQRFTTHANDLEQLLDALTDDDRGAALAAALHRIDDLFPDVLATVAAVVRGSP